MNAERKRGSIARFLLRFQVVALDGLIAAHALSVDAAVVTGNVKHFSRVPGLVVENWIRRPPP